MADKFAYAKVQSVSIPERGQLTYISEMSYSPDSVETANDWRWTNVVTMLITLDHMTHQPSFMEALRRELPRWANEHMLVTPMGILLPVRYEQRICDIPGLLTKWAYRIANAYDAVREERARWPKGIAVRDGMRAYKTFANQVVFFTNVSLYDLYGSNRKIMEMSVEECRTTGYLTETELHSVPLEWCVPSNFFD